MRTSIYIDGLNLYHGSVQGTQFKWLDLFKFCRNVIGKNINGSSYNIDTIKYFTAPAPNPNSSLRQMAYINAMSHSYPSIFSVTHGYFTRNRTQMPVVNPPPYRIEVFKTEEKGTDVNLSVHLLNDAWLNNYDCCVVVSNDGDMAEAMSLVSQHHPNKTIGLINPIMGRRMLDNLKKHAQLKRRVRRSHLANSQLPPLIPGTNIQKPRRW